MKFSNKIMIKEYMWNSKNIREINEMCKTINWIIFFDRIEYRKIRKNNKPLIIDLVELMRCFIDNLFMNKRHI